MRRIFLDSSVIIAACGSRSGASHAVIIMAENCNPLKASFTLTADEISNQLLYI